VKKEEKKMFDSCRNFTPKSESEQESAAKPGVVLVNGEKGERRVSLRASERQGKRTIEIDPDVRYFHALLSRAIVFLPKKRVDGSWPIKEKYVGAQISHSGPRRHSANGVNFDIFRVFLHHEVDEYLEKHNLDAEIGYKLQARGGHKIVVLFFRKGETETN